MSEFQKIKVQITLGTTDADEYQKKTATMAD